MTHECKYCDKNYKHRQSLNNHINSKHPQNNSKTPQNNSNNLYITQNKSEKYECEYCFKLLSRQDNLKRHLKICKVKKGHFEEYYEMKQEIIELKNKVKELMNDKCKIHPKTLQKINNQMNAENMTNIQNQNNIEIKINGFSKENIETLFSDKEKVKILNHKFNSLLEIIKYTHFNNLYPENQNIKMTSLKNNIAYIYDDSLNKYTAVSKDTLINELIMHRMIDIDEFYTNVYEKLNEKTKDCIKQFVNEFYDNEENFKKKHNEDVKFLIYNMSE
jgi:hypothetical protein